LFGCPFRVACTGKIENHACKGTNKV
jgi:hypothetical protein